MICTASYERRFRGTERQRVGKGVKWEGTTITQALYDSAGKNRKFIPVLFSAADAAHVPHVLRRRYG